MSKWFFDSLVMGQFSLCTAIYISPTLCPAVLLLVQHPGESMMCWHWQNLYSLCSNPGAPGAVFQCTVSFLHWLENPPLVPGRETPVPAAESHAFVHKISIFIT